VVNADAGSTGTFSPSPPNSARLTAFLSKVPLLKRYDHNRDAKMKNFVVSPLLPRRFIGAVSSIHIARIHCSTTVHMGGQSNVESCSTHVCPIVRSATALLLHRCTPLSQSINSTPPAQVHATLSVY
jgi:hypothetical protein